MMRLLVIGHSVFDYISDGSGNSKSAGGIYYSISALNRLAETNDSIFLVTSYDDETFNFFESEYRKVKKDLLTQVDKIPRVYLNLHANQERHEKYENISNRLLLSDIDYNQFDGILINMITGFDISIDQLIQLRKQYKGLIYFDVHTLSRGLDEYFKRNFRLIPDFNLWADCIDILQVNQSELFTLFNLKTEFEIIKKVLNTNVKIICVTKGKIGSKVYYKESGEIYSKFISASKIENPNVIGCGDVFGASFFYSYIRNKNVNESLSYAVYNTEKFVKSKFW